MSLLTEPKGRQGFCWLAALVTPLIILGITVARVKSLPLELNGSAGLNALVLMWIGVIEASFLALVLSTASWLRGERGRRISLFTGVPGAVLMVGHMVWLEFVYSKFY